MLDALNFSCPPDLVTSAILGKPEDVARALNQCFVMHHVDARVSAPAGGEGFGRQKKFEDANIFNGSWPSTVVAVCDNGSKVILGGMECARQATAPGARSEESGLRPSVVDARGDEWAGHPVRGLVSDTPQQHHNKGVQHIFFPANWTLKHENSMQADAEITRLLHQVCIWLAAGHDVIIHCMSSLTPFGFLFLMPYVLPPSLLSTTGARCRRRRPTDDTTGPPPAFSPLSPPTPPHGRRLPAVLRAGYGD